MKLIVLGGFLGSGKTSLLLSLAEYITGLDSPVNSKLVIIENEAGTVSIDDEVIRAKGYSVRTLFSGCICCSLNSDLIAALRDIASTIKPEWVIVEATGLAFPAGICGKIREYATGFDSLQSLAVVDCQRWWKLYKTLPEMIMGQLDGADVVLVNKTDLASPSDVRAVNKDLSLVNSRADVFFVSAKSGIEGSVWREIIHV